MSASANGAPSLRGKTVAAFLRDRGNAPVVVRDCMMEDRGGRLFLVGAGVSTRQAVKDWTEGVRRAIAWDAVDEYLLFDSPDEYYERVKAAPPPAAAEFPPILPMFEAPQGEEGFPVEPSGIRVESETPLEVGAKVLAFSQERWWRADVIAVHGDQVTIHYPGWDSTWDVTVPKTELQIDLAESLESDEPTIG